MATQTRTQRQRRRGRTSARDASSTSTSATITASRKVDAASASLDALGRRAQRAMLIQLGAAASVRDAVVRTARTYSRLDKVTRELDRLEQRGARAARRGRG